MTHATLLAMLFLAGQTVHQELSPGDKRPNVVVVITDDQGYGDIGAHGNPLLKTPHLDSLHAQSARFTNFLVSPTCSPTRAALLTGRHEFKSGVTHTILERERLALSASTLPQAMREGGYTTGIFGKWHLGDEDDYLPGKRGFDKVCIHGAGGIGQTYAGSCGDAPGNKYTNPALWCDGAFVKETGYCTDIFFRRAMNWMAEMDGKKPFFCWIATNAPHAPLQVRPEDEARYAGKVTAEQAKFFGMVANIDDNIGRLMAFLHARNLRENTLVLFLTDNGGTAGVPVFNDGMRGAKGTVWRGGTRGCSFWSLPGRIPPGDIDTLAAHLDVAPTLLDYTQVPVPKALALQMEGRSLKPLIQDKKAPWEPRMLVSHLGRWPAGKADAYVRRVTAIQDGRWKLIQPLADKDGPWKLFDLAKDPGEKTDLAASQPDLVKAMADQHDAWWRSVRPGLVNENKTGPAINPFKERYWAQFPAEKPPSTR